MRLDISLLNAHPLRLDGLWKYQTNDGELDVLDDDNVVIMTFPKGEWLGIFRQKEEGEEWPRELADKTDTDDETDSGDDDFSLDVKIPGA